MLARVAEGRCGTGNHGGARLGLVDAGIELVEQSAIAGRRVGRLALPLWGEELGQVRLRPHLEVVHQRKTAIVARVATRERLPELAVLDRIGLPGPRLDAGWNVRSLGPRGSAIGGQHDVETIRLCVP